MSKIDSNEVKIQLDKVLKSADFQRSQRLSGFLKYIVKKSLDGKESEITGYSIGVDVFGKAESFDSDADSSVRVEAVRLRKALALYFHGEGKNDKIIINVPRGGYRPVFLNNADAQPTKSGKQRSGVLSSFLILFSILLLLIVALWSGAPYFQKSKYGLPKVPVVAIKTFDFVGGISTEAERKELTYLFSQKFSRFSSLRNIVLEDGINQTDISYDYLLEGTVRENAENVVFDALLLDNVQDTVVWRFQKKYDLSYEEEQNWKDVSSSEVVSALASMHGIIDAFELKKHSDNTLENNESYKCLLDYMAYDNNKTEEKHLIARTCLEKIVAHYPDYSLAWSYLTWIYGDEVRSGLNPRYDVETTKKMALEAGLKAVEANQMSARAHVYLSTAAHLNDRIDLMKRHTKLSVELNPYDTDALASAAWKYGSIGEWELNRKYGEAALKYNPNPPKWYHGAIFAYYFYKDMHDKALYHAIHNFQAGDVFSHFYLIAAYVSAGEIEKATKLAYETKLKFPKAVDDLDEFLSIWHLPEQIRQKFVENLSKAGISP